jgi:tRNA pseudouridine13 synthase
MKVKQRPADFRVEEVTSVAAGVSGAFALYRLDKVGWTTPDVVSVIRRRWDVPADHLSYGGLKDRHADTSQHLTIHRGPRRNLSFDGCNLTYLGLVGEPFTSQHIVANRFTVVVRHLTADQVRRAEAAIVAVGRSGLPNYFDDQRFGSVSRGGGFVARALVAGRFEEGLKLALAAPYEFDRPSDKRDKAALRHHWGDWPACKAALGRGHARSLIDYLVSHPADFKGAVARLRPDLQGLYLSAYQSDVWNRMLDRWLVQNLAAEHRGRVAFKVRSLAVPTHVPDELSATWEALTLPLPSARQKPDPGAAWAELAEAVLADDGLTLAAMKIPGLDRPYFSKGERAGCVRPAGLTSDPADDELNRGRRKLTLRFELPRGSYATMLVKRLTAL